MAYKRSREKGNADFRKGVIPELPRTTVKRVHELRLAGENTDRHSARDDFAIGRKVGPDTEQRLAAALMHPETRYHFVKYEGCTRLPRDLPYFLEKLHWLQAWVTALDRLNEDGREIIRVLPNPF
jgi:hypothetical protein